MKPLPTVVCRCAMPGECSSIPGTFFFDVLQLSATTKDLQLPNCAGGSMWISKQGFLETGLGMLMDRHGECTGLCLRG